MRIDLPIGAVLFLNLAGWTVIQIVLAWVFTRAPVAWFRPRPAFRWEDGGRFYERCFRIRAWKDRLPDAAAWFDGGFAKARLLDRGRAYRERLVKETWRGELCHWAALAFTPLFFLWNPGWADLVMATYAVGANLPCILAQRYNRARLERGLQRSATGR